MSDEGGSADGQPAATDDASTARRRAIGRRHLRTSLVVLLVAGLVALVSLLLGDDGRWAMLAVVLASGITALLGFRSMLELNDPMVSRAEADARSRDARRAAAASDACGDEPAPSP